MISFGGLEELETSGISVTEQIEVGYQNDCIKDIMRELSPEKLAKTPDWENMTPEQFKQALEQLPEDVNLQKSYTEQERQSTGTVPWHRKKSIRC